MKTVTRKVYRKVGKRYIQVNEIRCTVCGAATYADGPKKTRSYLKRTCNLCDTLQTADRRGIKEKIFERERKKEINKRLSPTDKTFVHGLSQTPIYRVWLNMLNRCFDDSYEHYEVYGGRGITVTDRWLDVQNFYEDMGQPPKHKELDRINSDGHYEPGNCRWVTRQQNQDNRRDHYTYTPENLGWWHQLGLKSNPYIYGPMPWKKTNLKARRQEAVERGWYSSDKNPEYMYDSQRQAT